MTVVVLQNRDVVINTFNYFFQVLGDNNSRIGKISSLPANILKIITNFDRLEKSPKFPMGPTISKPGPILFKVAAIAVKVEVKSKLSKLTINKEPANINK